MNTTTSIARDMYLILTNDSGGPEAFVGRKEPLAAGALLDLVLDGRIALGDEKDPQVSVLDESPTGDPVRDHVLAAAIPLARSGKKLSHILGHRHVDPTKIIAAALAEEGQLEERRGLLGTRYVTRDGGPEVALRARLVDVVSGEVEPSLTDAAVLALLRAQDLAHPQLKKGLPGVSKKDLHARIEEITEGVPVADTVRRSYEAMQMVMLTTVFVPITFSGS